MGSTNSKVIASAGEVGPGRIGPFLLRKFEEFKKCGQRPTTTIPRESTLSKKKLLKEDEDAKSNCSLETEAVYKVMMVTSPRKSEAAKVVPLPDTEQTNQEEGIIIKTEKEDEGVDERNNDDDVDDDDEVDIDRLICPSSPSFRIYCIPDQECKEEETECCSVKSDKSNSQEMHKHQKRSSEESVASIHSIASSTTSKISNERVERDSRTKRKGNTKKKFRDVRKLIKVKSLYPSCTCAAGNDEVHPIRAKSAK